MGRPVVVEEGGGADEAIEPGVTGWLAPAGDPTALAQALDRALSLSIEQRAQLARTAQQNMKHGFGLAAANAQLLQIYQGLAD
jgi:glycosyltransferase involved in cell wall biosynthesis